MKVRNRQVSGHGANRRQRRHACRRHVRAARTGRSSRSECGIPGRVRSGPAAVLTAQRFDTDTASRERAPRESGYLAEGKPGPRAVPASATMRQPDSTQGRGSRKGAQRAAGHRAARRRGKARQRRQRSPPAPRRDSKGHGGQRDTGQRANGRQRVSLQAQPGSTRGRGGSKVHK
jgi:hypothetical protein